MTLKLKHQNSGGRKASHHSQKLPQKQKIKNRIHQKRLFQELLQKTLLASLVHKRHKWQALLSKHNKGELVKQ